VDRHAADVVADGLDLPGMDTDAHLDPGVPQGGEDGRREVA
jgi:hypothetical protein